MVTKSDTIAEQRYRSIVNNAPVTMILLDQAGLVLEINKRGEQLLNSTRDHIVGKEMLDFISARDVASGDSILHQFLQQKLECRGEIHVQPFDRSVRLVELMATSLEANEEKLLLLVMDDITERKHQQAQTIMRDKLATVGTMAAGFAHEINSPIAWVLANMSYLQENANLLESFGTLVSDPNLQQKIIKVDEVVRESIKQIEHIRDIAKDLKVFEHMDKDEISPVDVNKALEAALNIVLPEIKHRAKVEKEFAKELPLLLIASNKLHQVFLNLFLNAAAALEDGNSYTNKIRVRTRLENNRIRIDIEDTGKGIPKDILPKIFDPFLTTKPVGSSTGLGLTICHEIVNSYGGEIRVDSVEGKGTTFTIYLPVGGKSEDTGMLS